MINLKTFVLLSAILLFINCSNQENDTKELTVADKSMESITEVPQEKSLFDRLGGKDGISSIVDSMAVNHLGNPVINEKYTQLMPWTESFETFKTHVKEFLEAETGGTAAYTGKDMLSAHTGLNITEREFLSTTDDVLKALDSNDIDEETKKDVLYILYSLKDSITYK
tara:strand:- start:12730 stop:13233 length:504 start_codon:yes stop_codon:yes gene_type:complete